MCNRDQAKPVLANSVVAVHGLHGHPRLSWTSAASEQTSRMWLQDLLPKHMPNARIMTYGYNSDIDGENALLSAKGLDYAAAKLLEGLAEKRLDRQVNAMLSQHLPKVNIVQCNDPCPITFIAHDLGGIVVKKVNTSVRIFSSRGNTDGMDNCRP